MTDSEFKILTTLQEIRNPALDSFFRFLNFFDTPLFVALLIAIVWLGVNQKWGVRLFFICALSALVNIDLKEIFAAPRPFILMPNLALVAAKGYSFPSGGAQGAVVNFGMLAYLLNRKKWAWPCAIAMMLLIGFSRLYLGVHFLQDVVWGLIIGSILLYSYIRLLPIAESWLAKKTTSVLFNLSFFVPLLLMSLHISPHSIGVAFVSMGIGIGWIASHRIYELRLPILLRKRFALVIFALAGIFVLYSLKKNLQGAIRLENVHICIEMIGNLLTGYWLSFGALYIYHNTGSYRFKH